MTLQGFRDILLSADGTAQHYRHMQSESYTRWMETGAEFLSADSRYTDGTWAIRVERYTKTEYDPVVERIHAALDTDEIASAYRVAYLDDDGYIVHVWDCSVEM